MYIEEENYYYIEKFKKNGVYALYTKKNAGDFSDESILKHKENHIKEFIEKLKKNYKIIYAKQTHSDNIKIIKENDEKIFYEDIDGFITKRKDIVIITKYADCLPIFLYDLNKEIIGVVHSGWQGTYKGIALKALDIMQKEYDSNKKDILIGLGIGIKSCCYEVKQDFYEKFIEKYSFDKVKDSFEKREDKIYFDNEKLNFKLLLDEGIEEKNIIKSGICTFCSNQFFSYRKNKDTERNAGIIFFELEFGK